MIDETKLDDMAQAHADFIAKWYKDVFKHGYGHGWEDALELIENLNKIQDSPEDLMPETKPKEAAFTIEKIKGICDEIERVHGIRRVPDMLITRLEEIQNALNQTQDDIPDLQP